MATKGNKFGAFKGVFTPSILTILGVIMYLRLPWIVGEAGLLVTLSIIFVAHLISGTTGLSVASIATDKRVETGGTYFMISRSLGLPIGGTLGLALFVGLSFSVSLYLIGFSETFLTALGFEVSLNNIRLTGAIVLLAVTILTFLSTSLALKTQFIILAVMVLSLLSIFLGRHEFSPESTLIGTATNAVPWIVLFAVFFPAVTGFEAGVSMSGDLKDPKKSIPVGTITAILVGLIVYTGLAFFLSSTVSRDMLKDPSVLYRISWFSPLVVAGIWGATLSSALGSILGAPRILQATAIDKITPRFFAKGFGASNEPRNALLLTFLIAFAGIMIGDLNAIARIVTIFFIITYGFLNLTSAIENIASSDFRPSFRVPAWVGFLGAIACFVVMIQLDIIAMLGATLILGALFLYLKRQELNLQSGDTWGGVWATLVKFGIGKLLEQKSEDKRNWRPNIILFSGSGRSHLISLSRLLVGRLGVFTNFELLEEKTESQLFTAPAEAVNTTDSEGRFIFTRRHTCMDIYEGMNTISRVYGFTGFEPNTILMGWGRKTKEPEKFLALITQFGKLDYNLVFYSHKGDQVVSPKKSIDLWWKTGSSNLEFGITLIKFITGNPAWRQAKIRILYVSEDQSANERIHAVISQMLVNHRLEGSILAIDNAVERKPTEEVITQHSDESTFLLLDFELGGNRLEMKTYNSLNLIIETCGQALIIQGSSVFSEIEITGLKYHTKSFEVIPESAESLRLADRIYYPDKEILASELYSLAVDFEAVHEELVLKSLKKIGAQCKAALNDFEELGSWAFDSIGESLKDDDNPRKKLSILYSDYLFQAERYLATVEKELLPALAILCTKATTAYLEKASARINTLPERISVEYNPEEIKIKKSDSLSLRLAKRRKKALARLLKTSVTRRVPVRYMAQVFLFVRRKSTNLDLLNTTGITITGMLSLLRRSISETQQLIQNASKKSGDLVSANLLIKQGKEKLTELNRTMTEEITGMVLASTQKSTTRLQTGFERISFMLGNPGAEGSLKKYERALNNKQMAGDFNADLVELLHNNLLLYLNKSEYELKIHALKARVGAKILKHAEELNIMIENRIKKPLGGIKDKIEALKHGADDHQLRTFFDKLVSDEQFDLENYFSRFYKGVQELISDLPAEVRINHPDFINKLSQGSFTEAEAVVIDFRKQAQLWIGREMTNSLRVELDKASEQLNSLLTETNNIIRLLVFNIENISPTDEINSSASPLSEVLSKEILDRIDSQQNKASSVFDQTMNNINLLIDKTFKPLLSLTDSNTESSVETGLNEGRLKKLVNSVSVVSSRFFRKQLVKVIYTRSEGLLLARRLSKSDNHKRKTQQGVFEILENLEPRPDVLKKLPFFYSNLFAGNSTINKDLWVGMEKQILEARAAVRYFERGYGGAFLITGERNSGKSSLSRYIAREFADDNRGFIVKALKEGSVLIQDLHNAIIASMNSSLEVDYLLDIQASRQVFVINDLELWWQRTPDGAKAIEELLRLIDKFGKKHLFIINCRTWSFNLMNRYIALDKYFSVHIECEAFDARELKEMIMSRHRAGGMSFRLDGKNEADFSEYDYAKLFNRYFMLTGGNPGSTVKAWISNIVDVNDKTLEIAMPRLPDTASLADLENETCMILLQFVLHRRFTVQKLAKVLRKEHDEVAGLISALQRAGLIEEKFPSVYTINPYLERLLVDQLKERKFL